MAYKTLVTKAPSTKTPNTTIFHQKLIYSDYMPSSCVANVDLTGAANHKNCEFLFIMMQLVTGILMYAFWNYNLTAPLLVMLLVYILSILYLHFGYVTNENVIAVRGLGLQITKTYFTGRKAEQFFPTSCISDIILRQAVNVHRVVDFVGVKTCDANNEIRQSSIGQDVCPKQDLLTQICIDLLTILQKPKSVSSTHVKCD